MNNTIISTHKIYDGTFMVYRKCNKCGQIVCNTECYGSVFIATECPSCGIPFVSPEQKSYKSVMIDTLKNMYELI